MVRRGFAREEPLGQQCAVIVAEYVLVGDVLEKRNDAIELRVHVATARLLGLLVGLEHAVGKMSEDGHVLKLAVLGGLVDNGFEGVLDGLLKNLVVLEVLLHDDRGALVHVEQRRHKSGVLDRLLGAALLHRRIVASLIDGHS